MLLWDGQNIMSLVNLILKWRVILLIPGLMLPLRFVASLFVEWTWEPGEDRDVTRDARHWLNILCQPIKINYVKVSTLATPDGNPLWTFHQTESLFIEAVENCQILKLIRKISRGNPPQ